MLRKLVEFHILQEILKRKKEIKHYHHNSCFKMNHCLKSDLSLFLFFFWFQSLVEQNLNGIVCEQE